MPSPPRPSCSQETSRPPRPSRSLASHACIRWRQTSAPCAQSNSEGVHQMRVGLRRLRAAISLFREIVPGAQTEEIEAQLRDLKERCDAGVVQARATVESDRYRTIVLDTALVASSMAGGCTTRGERGGGARGPGPPWSSPPGSSRRARRRS